MNVLPGAEKVLFCSKHLGVGFEPATVRPLWVASFFCQADPALTFVHQLLVLLA